MSDLFKRGMLDVLVEACYNESLGEDDEYEVDQDLEDLEDDYEDIEEIEDDIEYTEEMVNVICQETSLGNRYVIEYDNLVKLMETKNIDNAKKAMEMVCEHNSISIADTYLLLESNEYISEIIEEQEKKEEIFRKKSDKKFRNSYKVFRQLKDDGVKLLKKKSKKSKKRK